MKDYPNEFTMDEYEDFTFQHKAKEQYFDEEEQYDDKRDIVIEDRTERFQAVKLFAKENGGQIYTQVDLDSGEIGYSKGPRIVNSLGLYVVIKIPGYRADNS
tara:strand:- start:156 stop:461 length:306 start_codon:yes stop_codon:yes gene_type:complete